MNQEVKTLGLAEVLFTLDGGGVVEDIQERMREVARAVTETGKAGSVTIKLDYKPNGKGTSKQLFVTDKVSSVVPKQDRAASIFWATEDGNLTRDNLDQPRLPMRGAK